MNVIDISNWQFGINLADVFAQNPLDAVIVKSTGGVSYVNPSCDGWVQWLIEHGKPFGFYHFLNDDGKGSSGAAEAAYFVNNTRNYFGKGIPFADYEGNALQKGTKYLKEFLDGVLELTGIRPIVYCSLSVISSQDFSEIAAAGYKLWVAQYATNNPVYGFQENPWQSGSVAPFNGFIMQQYSGNGRLKGCDNALDLDKFFGSYALWLELARGDDSTPPSEDLKPADPVVISDILHGKYSAGSERRSLLREAGYDYESCQDMVNALYATALSCRKYVKPYEDYMNSIVYILHVL